MSLKVIGTDMYRSATSDFLLTFHSNHGPISHRFRDRRRLQAKIAKFSNPVYFTPTLTGVPWNWVWAQGVKTLEWWGYQMVENVLR